MTEQVEQAYREYLKDMTDIEVVRYSYQLEDDANSGASRKRPAWGYKWTLTMQEIRRRCSERGVTSLFATYDV